MGEVSNSTQRREGSLIGIATELNKVNPPAQLCLLVVQYLSSHSCEVPNMGRRKPSIVQCLQSSGPVLLRSSCYRIVSLRNLIAHALYTQLYDVQVKRSSNLVIDAANVIMDYEISLRGAKDTGSRRRINKEFWGYDRPCNNEGCPL